MSTKRTHLAELGRLLNSTIHPIWVLDGELTVVFVNQAAQQWLESDSSSLLGQRCTYQSTASDDKESVCATICPPPQVLEGKAVSAIIGRLKSDGHYSRRQAKFLPLGINSENLLGVVGILDVDDLAADIVTVENNSVPEDTPATVLHEQIQKFRQEMVARFRADRLIGTGPAMRLARRQLEIAIAGDMNVLLVGPQGSGRQHLATAIHYGSRSLSSSPATSLTPIDCALLGNDILEVIETLIARERILHGSEFRATVLLHRVDELPPDLQVELVEIFLRRCQRFRILSTASLPLIDLSRRGKFHHELAAMLSTIVIELPALTERREDIPLLAQMFLEEQNANGRRQLGGFTSAALDLLNSYSWPGNLDELAQVVAEAHSAAKGREIDVSDLPERIRLTVQAAAMPRRTDEKIVLEEYLRRVERELIRRALIHAKGNKAKAARLLGMTRPKLYRRMVQLGLEDSENVTEKTSEEPKPPSE